MKPKIRYLLRYTVWTLKTVFLHGARSTYMWPTSNDIKHFQGESGKPA